MKQNEMRDLLQLICGMEQNQEESGRSLSKLLSLKSGLMDDLLTGRVRTNTLPERLFE